MITNDLRNRNNDISGFLRNNIKLLPNSDTKGMYVLDNNLSQRLQMTLTHSVYHRILLPIRELGLVEWVDENQGVITDTMLVEYIVAKLGLPKSMTYLILKIDGLFLYNDNDYDTLVRTFETIFGFIAKYIFLLTGENVSTPDTITTNLTLSSGMFGKHDEVINGEINVMRINLDKYIGKDLFKTSDYTIKGFDLIKQSLTTIDKRYCLQFHAPIRFLEYINEGNREYSERGILSNWELCSYLNQFETYFKFRVPGKRFFPTILALLGNGIKGKDIPTNSKDFKPWFLTNEKFIIKVKCQALGLDDKWTRWVTDRYLFGDHEAKEERWLFDSFFNDTKFLCLLSIGRLSSDVAFVKKRIERNFDILYTVIIGRGITNIEEKLKAYDRYLCARNWYDGYTNVELYGHKVPLHHHTVLEKASSFLASEARYFADDFGLYLKQKHPDISARHWSELVMGSIRERELAVEVYGEYHISSFGTEEELTKVWISDDEIKNSPLGYLDDKWIILKNPLELLSWASRFKNCSFQYSEDCDICNQMILIYTGFSKPVMVQIDFTAYDAGWFYTIGLEKYSTEEMSRYIGSICEVKYPFNETSEPENNEYLNVVYTHAINQYLLKELDGPNNVFTENAYGLTTSMIKEAIANFVFEHDLLKANL